MKLAITGASGYIGRRLVQQALALGHEVVVLCRRDPQIPGTHWRHYDLADQNPIGLPAATTHLIHLAANTSGSAMDQTTEVTAAVRLIAASQPANCRFIFISSQTASAVAPTAYGKVKWNIEQHVLAADGLVLRPGMVYGGVEQGLFGALVAFVRQHRYIPSFVPAPMVQPVHVDDLATAILDSTGPTALHSRVFCIGSPECVSFADFLQSIADNWLRVRRISLPIPVFLLSLLSRMLSHDQQVRTGLYRLTSLFSLPVMDTRADLATLQLALRPLHSGMTRNGNGRRRALLREALAMLTYVLRSPPSFALLTRHVRAIEHTRTPVALRLPAMMLACPSLLALVDNGKIEALRWRLQAAVLLAEATPQGARRFLQNEVDAGALRALVRILVAVMQEAGWRLCSLLASPFIDIDDSRFGPGHDN